MSINSETKTSKINLLKFFKISLAPLLVFGALSTTLALTSCNKSQNNNNKQSAIDAISSLKQTLAYKLCSSFQLDYFAAFILNEDINSASEKGTLQSLLEYITNMSGIGLTGSLTTTSTLTELVDLASTNGALRTSKKLPKENDLKWNELLKRVSELGKKIINVQSVDARVILKGLYNSTLNLASASEYGSLKVNDTDFDFIQEKLASKLSTDFSSLINGVAFNTSFVASINNDTTLKELALILYNVNFYENSTIISSNKSNELLEFAIDYATLINLLQENWISFSHASSLSYTIGSSKYSTSTFKDASLNNNENVVSNLYNALFDIQNSIGSIENITLVNFSSTFQTNSLNLRKTPTKKWNALVDALLNFKNQYDIFEIKSDVINDMFDDTLPYLVNTVDKDSFAISDLLTSSHHPNATNFASDEFLYYFNQVTQSSLTYSSTFSQTFLNKEDQTDMNPKLRNAKGNIQDWKNLQAAYAKFISFDIISLIEQKSGIDKNAKLIDLLQELPQGFVNLEWTINNLVPEYINEKSTVQNLANLIKQDAPLTQISAVQDEITSQYWIELHTLLTQVAAFFNTVNYNDVNVTTVVSDGSSYTTTTTSITCTLPYDIDSLTSSNLTTSNVSLTINNHPIAISLISISNSAFTISITNDQSSLWKEGDCAYIAIKDLKINNNFYRFSFSSAILHKAPVSASFTATSVGTSGSTDTSLVALTLSSTLAELEKQDFIGKIHIYNSTSSHEIPFDFNQLKVTNYVNSKVIDIPVSSGVETPYWKNNDSVTVSIDTIYKNGQKYTFSSSSSLNFYKAPVFIPTIVENDGIKDQKTSSLVTIKLLNPIKGLTSSILKEKISLSLTKHTAVAAVLNVGEAPTPSYTFQKVTDNEIVIQINQTTWNWEEGETLTLSFTNFIVNNVEYTLPQQSTILHKIPTNISFSASADGVSNTTATSSLTLSFTSLTPTSKDPFDGKIKVLNKRTKNYLTLGTISLSSSNIVVPLSKTIEWEEGDMVDIEIDNVTINYTTYSFTFNSETPILLHNLATSIAFTLSTDGTEGLLNSSYIKIQLTNYANQLTEFFKDDFDGKVTVTNTTTSKPLTINESKTVFDGVSGVLTLYLQNPNEWNQGNTATVAIANIEKGQEVFTFSSSSVTLNHNNTIEFTALGDGVTNTTTDTSLTITLSTAIETISTTTFEHKIKVRRVRDNALITFTISSVTDNKIISLSLSDSSQWLEGEAVEVQIDSFLVSEAIYSFNPVITYLHKQATNLTFSANVTTNEYTEVSDYFEITISDTSFLADTDLDFPKIRFVSQTTKKDLKIELTQCIKRESSLVFCGNIKDTDFSNNEVFNVIVPNVKVNGVLYTFNNSVSVTLAKTHVTMVGGIIKSHNGLSGSSDTTRFTIKLDSISKQGLIPGFNNKMVDSLTSKMKVHDNTKNCDLTAKIMQIDTFESLEFSVDGNDKNSWNEIEVVLTDPSEWNNEDEISVTFQSFKTPASDVEWQIKVTNVLKLAKNATAISYSYSVDGEAATTSSKELTIIADIDSTKFSYEALKQGLKGKIKMKNYKTSEVLTLGNVKTIDVCETSKTKIVVPLPEETYFKDGELFSFFIDKIQNYDSHEWFSFESSVQFIKLNRGPVNTGFDAYTDGYENISDTTSIEIVLHDASFLTDYPSLFTEKISVKNVTNSNSPISVSPNVSFVGNNMKVNLLNPSEWREGDTAEISIADITFDGVVYKFISKQVHLHKSLPHEILAFTSTVDGIANSSDTTKIELVINKKIDFTQEQISKMQAAIYLKNGKILRTDSCALEYTDSNSKTKLTFTISYAPRFQDWNEGDVITNIQIPSVILNNTIYDFKASINNETLVLHKNNSSAT